MAGPREQEHERRRILYVTAGLAAIVCSVVELIVGTTLQVALPDCVSPVAVRIAFVLVLLLGVLSVLYGLGQATHESRRN